MNTPRIQLYGQEMLEKFDLISKRREFEYNFDLTDDNIKTFVEDLLGHACDDMVVVRKELLATGLKFHIDDCQLITMKNPPTYNVDCYIHLEGSKYLEEVSQVYYSVLQFHSRR